MRVQSALLLGLSGLVFGINAPAMAQPRHSAPLMAQTKAAQSQTIVEIAQGNQSFSTLVAALKAAGLVEALSGKGPFTVFAPTNEAFAALPKGTLETLLKPENKDKLVKILTYHVVSGDITSAQIQPGPAKTLEGQNLMIKVKDGKVKVNKATVISADVDASNGVIHVVNQVLLPPDLFPKPNKTGK